MPKTKISEYSSTANSNTDVASINVDEGCAPSGINNAIRAVMGHLKDFQVGTNGDPFNGPVNGTVGATTASTGAFTTLAASSTVSGTGFSTYLASPPAIGGTAAAAVSSTALSYTTTLTGGTGIVNIGSGQIYKDASGNVGIGTSSPAISSVITAVNVKSTSASGPAVIVAQSNDGACSVGLMGGNSTSDNPAITWQKSLRFGAVTDLGIGGFTERMRIDSSGNLLVGTTSAGGVGVSILPSGDLNQMQAGYLVWKLTGYNGNYYFNYNGSDQGTISGSTGVYTALSDVNKKTNIQDSSKGLEVVLQLRPVNYEMIDGEGTQELGFIAQEVETLIPEAYIEQEGSNGTFIGLSDRPIIAVLVKAIQEQQALITTLTERITALEQA